MSEPKYNTDALYAGIDQCKRQIQVLEDAIQRERDTINEYYGMINVADSKRRQAEKNKKASEDNEMTILSDHS